MQICRLVHVWIFACLGLLWLTQSGCGDPRRGALSPESRTELTSYALRNVNTPMKYYKLMERMAQLLDQASANRSTAAAMEAIQKFRADNELALGVIAQEFDGWQRHVGHDELIDFVYTLNQQPYTRKVRQLAPAFRRRVSDNDQYLREFDELMSVLEMRL